jgi:hypothetical protein
MKKKQLDSFGHKTRESAKAETFSSSFQENIQHLGYKNRPESDVRNILCPFLKQMKLINVDLLTAPLEYALHESSPLWRKAAHSRRLKTNSHIPCRSHAVPKGFRFCLSHLIYTVRPCLFHTCHAAPMPRHDHAVLKATSQGHGTTRHGYSMAWHV